MNYRTTRRIAFIMICIFTIFFLLISSFSQIAYGYTKNIRVDKDASVYEYSPDNNYGNDTRLRVGNYHSREARAYYHFNVSSLPKGWSEATIVVYFDYASSMVHVGANLTYDSWDEMTITWNNKPSGGRYRGHIYCDGFDFNIPLKPENFTNDEVTVCLYGKGGESDGFIQGDSKEGASSKDEVPFIKLTYDDKIEPIIIIIVIVTGVVMVVLFSYLTIRKISKERKKKINKFSPEWLHPKFHKRPVPLVKNIKFHERPLPLEKRINEYITLKLVNGRTYIYVNGKRFIQCIRLILNISKDDVPLYDEVDSIDEAAKLYSTHIHQNRIIAGRMGVRGPNQRHSITPEQEFWGHCSNIQAWVEHDYDTRILMSNISFPLLRELTKAGDPKASKVYKEEIALRLESGYPSVVQYLLTQGYIQVFSPSEFKTILESTDLIKNLSSEPRMLSQFLRSCVSKFPTLFEAIILQILKLPDGKNIFFSVIQVKPIMSPFRPYLRYNNPQFFYTLKTTLERLFLRVDEKTGEDIIDCIQVINNKLEGQALSTPDVSGRNYFEAIRNRLMNNIPLDELDDEQKLLFKQKILDQIRRSQSRCSYCGKLIPKGKEICEWCGHKKDDDEGFFPYPFIFKPPGGGGGGRLKEGAIAIPVMI